MTTFCKLKDGREMVVFSDNISEETMDVYPVPELVDASEIVDFVPEYVLCKKIPYSDIRRTDQNREGVVIIN